MTVTSLKFNKQCQAIKKEKSPVLAAHDFTIEIKGVREAGQALCKFVYEDYLSNHQGPLTILSFDEPNVLTDASDGTKESKWSLFSELRRILQRLDSNNLPIFTLFLSTSGNFRVLSPEIKSDPSRRVVTEELRPLRPITDISFDCLASPAVKDSVSLKQAVTIDWIAHLGRPL